VNSSTRSLQTIFLCGVVFFQGFFGRLAVRAYGRNLDETELKGIESKIIMTGVKMRQEKTYKIRNV